MSYLPQNDIFANGSITAQNTTPAGTATTGSAVEIRPQGKGAVLVQVTGTYTGALSLQGSIDGSTWVTLSGAALLTNQNTGAQSATIPSAAPGIYAADSAGFVKLRVCPLAAFTGTAVVSINASAAMALFGLDQALPAGSAALGSVTVSSATLAANQVITPVPQASQGAKSYHKNISAATTNATWVKTSAGVVNVLHLFNSKTTGTLYFKAFNKASAPTVGTDVPVLTIPFAPGTTVIDWGAYGLGLSTGIAYAITGAYADTDTTITAAGDAIVNINYT